MIEASGQPVLVGGNIGVPLSAQVEASTPSTWHVVETSSFQLETIARYHPRVAVWLNFSPDHLDRHITEDAYEQAKARMFENQTRGGLGGGACRRRAHPCARGRRSRAGRDVWRGPRRRGRRRVGWRCDCAPSRAWPGRAARARRGRAADRPPHARQRDGRVRRRGSGWRVRRRHDPRRAKASRASSTRWSTSPRSARPASTTTRRRPTSRPRRWRSRPSTCR